MSRMRRIFGALLLALAMSGAPDAMAICSGRFMNPVTDPCFRCMFPMRLGRWILFDKDHQLDNDSSNNNRFVCSCGADWVGLSISFWEPSHMVDISTDPYCTPGLGGKFLPEMGFPADGQGTVAVQRGLPGKRVMAYHYVTYRNPILVVLDVLSDNPCLDRKPFDILDFSAINPGWVDEQLGAILNPDAFWYGRLEMVLFGIPVGICATLETNDALCMATRRYAHWSVGFNGQTYPLSGFNEGRDSEIATSQVIAKRAFTLQHRTMRVWGTSGAQGLCGYYPKVMLDDTDYKLSMIFPLAQKTPINGKCCQPFGASTMVWGSGRTWPVTGEDFSYQVWRKRDCCIAGGHIVR